MSVSRPTPTPDTQFFWDEVAERRLNIQYCMDCARYYFYPRSHCRFCGLGDVEWRQVSGRARLVSYIINRRVTPAFAPYSPIIALVELEEGVTMMSNIVGVEADPAALELDMPLVVDYEEREGRVLPVFTPAEVR